MSQIDVELVEHTPGAPLSGIGRYTQELHRHLPASISARLTTQVEPPLSRYLTALVHLPIGVAQRRAGSLVHFMEDLGCSQMLWRPVHPAIATSHDLGILAWPPERQMYPAVDRLVRHLSYLGLKRMDAVITVSEFSRQMVIKRLKIAPEKVFAIHSGIDTATFRPIPDAQVQLAARYGLPNGAHDRYLIYVGTEIPRKNLSTVLRTLSRLPADVRLLKVGAPGDWRARASTHQAIRQLGLGGRVLFFEDVPDEDLALFYSAADAYIACSYLEGFCQPILEAMACGTPVVCSHAASLPEVAGDAAILLPPSDDRRFAKAVASVLEDDGLRERMVSRGLERARLFTWHRTAAKVASVYEFVSERRDTRRREGVDPDR